jgi:hypothetical protein
MLTFKSEFAYDINKEKNQKGSKRFDRLLPGRFYLSIMKSGITPGVLNKIHAKI